MCREVATAMDLLPTIARFAGCEFDSQSKIDGHDISTLLLGKPGAKSPTETFLYYTAKGELAGIRRGPWKLLFEHGLFHVEHDISEQWDRRKSSRELVAELTELAKARDAEITTNMRPTRKVETILFDPAR